MSSETDQNAGRSVLSWESVVDTGPTNSTPPAPARDESVPPPPPVAAPIEGTSTEPEPASLPPIDLAIAPLSLDPLPPIGEPDPNGKPADVPAAPVLGEFHMDLTAISTSVDTVVPQAQPGPEPQLSNAPAAPSEPAAPVVDPIVDSLELKIAPLDMPDLTPTGSVPTVDPAPTAPVPPPAAPMPVAMAPVAAPAPTSVPATPAPADTSGQIPTTPPPPVDPLAASGPVAAPPVPTGGVPVAAAAPAPTGDVPATAPQPAAPPAPAAAPAPSIPGLPADDVSADATPTTVIPGVVEGQVAPPAIPGSNPVSTAPVIAVPEYQPNQAAAPRVAPANPREVHVPAAAESRRSKKQQKQKKVKQQKSGGGGVALFFTLLVLVGIIVGAIVFGRPYLFPDDWDVDAKPYGEAVETVRGTDIAEPLLVNRQPGATYGVSMADHLLGAWEADLPMWRSLALAKGPIDAPGMRDLVANWTPAYYSSENADVVANSDLLPAAVDGAITQAMALAAIDQETNWSAQRGSAALDGAAIAQAAAISESKQVSASTSFGAAEFAERRVDVAAFLPPVLEYRTNAPEAFAEFDATTLASVTGTELLALSQEPELVDGDTMATAQQQMDRTFWYLVFASYNSAPDAYAASNALVQSSLATFDRAGVQCTAATFSGTDAAGTEQVAAVLQTWAASAPVEMGATTTALPNGTLQLTSCDPGPGFETNARFGVAREIARFRSVEIAALENVAPAAPAADRTRAVQAVRDSQAAVPMLDQPFDTSFAESARMARALVFTADGSLGTAPPVTAGE